MAEFRSVLAGLALALAAAPALAATYDCSFKKSKPDAYVAAQVRLTVDEASGRATAYDSYVQAQHKAPIAARFKRRSGSSIQWDWEVQVPYKRNRSSQADFRVTLNTSTMRATIRAHVPGDFQESTGSGRCRAG